MNIKQLFTDEQAVSPVIGVILMVAITVILAAVIGTFVLGLGSNIQKTAPQATFEINSTQLTSSDDAEITHSTGDSIEASNLNITGDIDGGTVQWNGGTGTVSAGDSHVVGASSDNGGTIRVVWQSGSGSNSATLQTFEYES